VRRERKKESENSKGERGWKERMKYDMDNLVLLAMHHKACTQLRA
jgi:hypothetical protein